MVVQESIQKALEDSFNPVWLSVENESHRHSVPPNSETHFKVTVVSEAFDGLRKVARHQKVYGVLSKQLEDGVHALAVHTFTPGEWQEKQTVPDSPNCMGGSK